MNKIVPALLISLLAAPSWAGVAATLYKDPYCGCCDEYVKYLNANGFKVNAIVSNDMSTIKKQLGSDKMASCHTMQIKASNGRSYTVEGHVPVAAINKMLKQKPDIVGITVPGMPANSPGMGPEVKGTLKVYALNRENKEVLFSVE
ncbi:CopG family transcriptional regulator [Chitinibacter sp. SCUT-21]|uniref:DUF411 domain-containing protein n=1 Tax=Chitinibacter sp. SCUT-21 TaxID=2970891 RepID=UPI0035A7018A